MGIYQLTSSNHTEEECESIVVSKRTFIIEFCFDVTIREMLHRRIIIMSWRRELPTCAPIERLQFRIPIYEVGFKTYFFYSSYTSDALVPDIHLTHSYYTTIHHRAAVVPHSAHRERVFRFGHKIRLWNMFWCAMDSNDRKE